MIAWLLVGVLGATTILLGAFCLFLLRERAKVSGIVDDTLKMFKKDRDEMLATALGARGVQQINPDRAPVVVDIPRRRGIGAKIMALEAKDREEAAKREAQRRAEMDRDERINQEQIEAARLADAKRREMSVS